MQYEEQRTAVAAFMRRLYEQKLTTTSGGNISLRFDGDKVAITPGSLDKGRIEPHQVGVLTVDGANLTPELRPSSESLMHLRILQRCPKANAVVHAHPVTASAFTASTTPINYKLLSESYALMGEVVMAPYALSSTEELADIVADAAQKANCILMQNHGVTTVGRTLLEAFDRLELVEAAAQMTLIIKQLDGIRTLTDKECRDLDRLIGGA